MENHEKFETLIDRYENKISSDRYFDETCFFSGSIDESGK